MDDKLLQLLGFCQKAGKLVSGTDTVSDRIKKGNTHLVIGAIDLSDRLWEDIRRTCDYRKIDWVRIKTKLELGTAIGKSPRGLIAINDKSFAKIFIQCLSTMEGS